MRKRERGKKTTALTRTVQRMLAKSSLSRRTFARHVAAGCREHAKWPSWLVGSVRAPAWHKFESDAGGTISPP